MAIKKISKTEFDAFGPTRLAGIETIVEEKAWFQDDAGNLLGLVALDKMDKDWSFGLLGRDEQGRFRMFNSRVSLDSQEHAEELCRAVLEKVERSGQMQFPQGSP